VVSAPGVLGRGVVVNAGDDVPAPWAEAPVVVVDEAALADPAAVVGQLHDAWAGRRPVVVALAVDPARFREPVSYDVPEPWRLDPGFELWLDRLHFLVWANTYDARGGIEPVWWWSRKAMRLGASAPEGGDDSGVAVPDVVLPDGTPAWVDGGPRGDLTPDDVGAALVHAESIESGTLTSIPPRHSPGADGGLVVGLAADQLAAVAHGAGPARVIAPAGSGKTRVLTARLRHLLAERGYEPDGVAAVAYNRKARDEMAERTAGLPARILTLNALGYELVAAGLGRRPDVIEQREVRRLLEPLVPKVARRLNTDPLAPYIDALGAVRLGLRDPAEVEEARGDVPGLAEAFPAYRDELRGRGVIDFDEQVLLAIELLLGDGAFRRAQQGRHRHLLVDEFQDLTPAHVLLIRILAAPRFDVFGVGDDDQVIYGHAGATPRFLTEFGRYFPGAGEHALEVNYRCPAPVVAAVRNLLTRNQVRVPKLIRSARPAAPAPGDAAAPAAGGAEPGPPPGGPTGEGTPAEPGPMAGADGDSAAVGGGSGGGSGGDALVVRRHEAQRGAEELVGVVRGWLGEPGVRPGDVAVLARVGSLLLAPQVALVDAGLPVTSSLRPDVLRRTGLRAALAYLRIAAEPGRVDGRDLAEVYRRPSRGLPNWVEKWLARCRSVDDVAVAASRIDDAKAADRLESLATDLDQLGTLAGSGTTRAVLEHVRDGVGLGRAVELLDASGGGDGPSHRDDLEGLIQVADLHPDPAGFEPWLREVLDRPGDAAGVTLSTVHRVKGREWRRVAVFGATEGIVPHRLAVGRAGVEEERRVFHVAITRGIEQVVVLADAGRPSPFLAELDREATPDELAAWAAETAGTGAGRAGDTVADRRARRRERLAAAGASRAGRDGDGDGADAPAEVVEALRDWRRERSKADGVPAYVVLNDRHLTGIAERHPTDLEGLALCAGIGPARLEAYGDELVELLRSLGPTSSAS
jgi:DNA helicase II / ATP-dependent DNA helicase PcrA